VTIAGRSVPKRAAHLFWLVTREQRRRIVLAGQPVEIPFDYKVIWRSTRTAHNFNERHRPTWNPAALNHRKMAPSLTSGRKRRIGKLGAFDDSRWSCVYLARNGAPPRSLVCSLAPPSPLCLIRGSCSPRTAPASPPAVSFRWSRGSC
jgi:hypothetical protein